MAQLDRLIRDARKAMQVRNHTPMPAQRCKKGVYVICKPQPNEIQIGGEAVALNCNVATPKLKLSGVKLTIPIDKPDEISMEAVFGC